jgi:hypothetical protein
VAVRRLGDFDCHQLLAGHSSGVNCMKTAALLVMTMIVAGALTGCGSDSAAGAAAVPNTPAPATVTGLSTPKSVSVVTAN